MRKKPRELYVANIYGDPVVRETFDWAPKSPFESLFEHPQMIELSRKTGAVAVVCVRDHDEVITDARGHVLRVEESASSRTEIQFLASGWGARVAGVEPVGEFFWEIVLDSALTLTVDEEAKAAGHEMPLTYSKDKVAAALETWLVDAEGRVLLKPNGWPAGVMRLRQLADLLHWEDKQSWRNRSDGPPAPQTLNGMLYRKLATLLARCCHGDDGKTGVPYKDIEALVFERLGDESKKGRVHERKAPAYEAKIENASPRVSWAAKRKRARQQGWKPPGKYWFLD